MLFKKAKDENTDEGFQDGELPAHVKKVMRWSDILLFDGKPSAFFLRAVKDDRVSFDETAKRFSILLLEPITLENGERHSVVTIGEATVGMIRTATYSSKKGDEFGIGTYVMSLASGLPVAVFERIKNRDLKLISEAYSFFG